jgi:hypothetical protein
MVSFLLQTVKFPKYKANLTLDQENQKRTPESPMQPNNNSMNNNQMNQMSHDRYHHNTAQLQVNFLLFLPEHIFIFIYLLPKGSVAATSKRWLHVKWNGWMWQ